MTYDEPEQWPELIEMFQHEYPKLKERIGDFDPPLLWTADFMLDDAPDGGDAYVLGEFNCSCVGFTSQLDRGIQDIIAAEVVRRLDAHAKQDDHEDLSYDPAEIAELNAVDSSIG